ncbi:MAG: hypothetical protein GY869_25505 [Planctomycetes bacterium]|nr:hypothetical protein [Planctomycetota bacterium]
MDMNEQVIKLGTGDKTYSFNEEHNPDEPAQWWFQESDEGLILFIVFYTQACRWSKCIGCNLPSQVSLHHVPYDRIMNQVSAIFRMVEVKEKYLDIEKVIISNNGSVLDEQTFSSTALIYLVAKMNKYLPNLAALCLETRCEFVDLHELEFLKRALDEGHRTTDLELAIGLEAFDDHIRNVVFNKGLPLEVFEDFIKKVAEYKFRIKCYFMQKPTPDMSDQQAIEDVHRAIDYLSEISERFDVRVDMHLNPTYAAKGTVLAKKFLAGEYTPPYLVDSIKAVAHAEGKPVKIFVGLFDEGLAVEGGSFVRKGDERFIEVLSTFNRTQDYSLLHVFL